MFLWVCVGACECVCESEFMGVRLCACEQDCGILCSCACVTVYEGMWGVCVTV